MSLPAQERYFNRHANLMLGAGIFICLMAALSFALTGKLSAAFGGVLFIAQTGSITPTFGVQPVLIAFVAMIVGGFGSLPGAAVGGL